MDVVKKIKFSKVSDEQGDDEGDLSLEPENYSTMVKLEVGDDDQEMTEEVDNKDWMSGEDMLLPDGWCYKTVHGHTADYTKLLAPNGLVFNSKIKALNYVIENNYDEEDIRKIRESFVYDGWSESTLLPDNWKFRKCKSERNEYMFMAPTGEIFNSRKGLLDYLRGNPDITDEHIQNVQTLFDEIKATWVNNLQDYEDDDKTVPPGWRIKYFAGVKANREARDRCYILSPSGVRFQSRAKAIQYMVEGNYSQEHIHYMLQQLYLERWRIHPKLPENWRIKKKEYIKSQGSYLLTSEGFILTVKKAVEHIHANPDKYTAEDAVNVEEVAKTLTKERSLENTNWIQVENIPIGWYYRDTTLKNVPFKREYFLTDMGVELKGRVTAIRHLIDVKGKDVDDSDVLMLRLGLSDAGWVEPSSEMLPDGWLQKPIIGNDKNFKYLSPNYQEFKTLVDVYQFMKTNRYSSEVMNMVEQHLDFKEILRNKTLSKNTNNWLIHKWEEHDSLPSGWRVAEKTMRYGNKKYVYLSPSGFMLNKSIEALLLMMEEKEEDKYLFSMSQRLELDGWKTHNSLPINWRYCTERKHFPDNMVKKDSDIVFCTADHMVLSKSEAIGYLQDNNMLSDAEFSNLTLLMEGEEDTWRSDENLPENWRIKEISLSEKSIFRVKSPNNVTYDSILEAYGAMIKEGYRKSDLSKVMIKLREEGFEEHDNLPSGWLIIKNRGDNLFELLSREGVVYNTLDSALEQMSDASEYTDQDRLDLENLCLDLVEQYLEGKTHSVKGKRKGKMKSNFAMQGREKKKVGRKKGSQNKNKRYKRLKSEDIKIEDFSI